MRRYLKITLMTVLLPMAAMAAPRVEVLQDNLDHPWSLAFLPDNEGVLITLRGGELKRWQLDQGLSAPIRGVPKVWANGQGGLLDVVLAPDFAQSRRVWLSYAEAGDDGKAGTAVGYGRLSADLQNLEDFKTVFRQQPKLSTGNHFGGRMVFDGKGHLFIGLGENNQRPTAQDLDKLQGKVVRLTDQGEIPKDNPFVGRTGIRPEIWAYGIRNPQGMAMNPWSDTLWLNEHGPRGGDEINIPLAGKNYGWPLATHGINYSGQPIPEAKGKSAPNTEAPLHVWPVSPALSGMAFYNASTFPQWRHKLFIGALKDESLIVLSVDGNTLSEETRLLKDRGKRIRDVRVGPDGYLYLLTDEPDGELLKVSLE
ncbi:PQQ-dependent sugar dehydrogenase [Klebsiella aerogenes]|uniref:PQQ-dependent sugar dehydrogenase n=1 Tax=Klebsiella aerogenes TaxID=548 RepID=UPI0021A68A08|nr:PQQ-dependent sugar dehydrogenase [Klebsiella aerogenes]MCT1420079.1 PQQ-dependent sugar dehydrogenase [Klebsiella aerogenes]MCT1500745.1 PQQ-dependent sugar dehydrogenase [Klebsiella aerogenes]MCT1794211.1 PQQ-dependent sugar dehydrogenase [Klebsiella aerogenes]MCT2309177.1 PQQ-dependent sugar dehydrogenase [Klebsiella aerogenes]MCT2321074.1 PQQ-dependent sugar dehydrogenase [Klebsiella aerogenes]